MKTFIAAYENHNGLNVMIINEDSMEDATKTAKAFKEEYDFITEIDTTTKGIVDHIEATDPRDND